MAAKLISYSYSDGRSLDEQIAYCARVSNPSNQNSQDRDDERLIKYLIKNNHWSPFEMVNVCLEIKTSRDIARQILRHKSASFQEYSTRYAVVEELPVYKEARLQDFKNRQNSLETDNDDLKRWWQEKQEFIVQESNRLYQAALEQGIAKEVARSVLPEGLTPSTLLMNASIRTWIHYIQLRTGNGTQKEHREIALECAKAIEPVFKSITNFVTKE